MDNLPNGGKVVIVDDRFQEILPLINILNKNAIPVIYYSGRASELPIKPLHGIRLFFLDLRFSTNTDTKTIVSNACNILQTILGENNGPYLLIIWSSTGTDYKEELENAGIPILYLEIDQQIDSFEQIRTRVQSFMEMLICSAPGMLGMHCRGLLPGKERGGHDVFRDRYRIVILQGSTAG